MRSQNTTGFQHVKGAVILPKLTPLINNFSNRLMFTGNIKIVLASVVSKVIVPSPATFPITCRSKLELIDKFKETDTRTCNLNTYDNKPISTLMSTYVQINSDSHLSLRSQSEWAWTYFLRVTQTSISFESQFGGLRRLTCMTLR